METYFFNIEVFSCCQIWCEEHHVSNRNRLTLFIDRTCCINTLNVAVLVNTLRFKFRDIFNKTLFKNEWSCHLGQDMNCMFRTFKTFYISQTNCQVIKVLSTFNTQVTSRKVEPCSIAGGKRSSSQLNR